MTKVPCMVCSGIGTVEDGRPCPACNGDKEVTAGFGITEGHMMAMFRMVVDIADKADAIIAEQTAIRQDLTTAIGAIWNKVKDL